MNLESRSRIISLRLTDEEYNRFRSLCISRGLRNVSELVRSAVSQLIGEKSLENPSGPEIQTRISTLECRLADLSTAVAQMEDRLTMPPSLVASSSRLKKAVAEIEAD